MNLSTFGLMIWPSQGWRPRLAVVVTDIHQSRSPRPPSRPHNQTRVVSKHIKGFSGQYKTILTISYTGGQHQDSQDYRHPRLTTVIDELVLSSQVPLEISTSLA